MSRQIKVRTEKFELLCGYIEQHSDVVRKEGESDEDFEARKFTLHTTCVVREMDHNLDKDLADRSVSAIDLLGRHIISVGTITDPTRILAEVTPELLKGDYDYALLRMRVATLTGNYKFKIQCHRSKCLDESDQELDLDGIECVDMPDPLARLLTYTTEDGMELVFRHIKASDLDVLAEIVEDQEDEIRQVLGLKLVSLDGLTPKKSLEQRGRKCKTDEQRIREAIRMLEVAEINHREREEIRTKLEKMVGYPKLIFKAKCKKCRASWQQRLRIEPSFFLTSSED